MIQPNFNILLWAILTINTVSGVFYLLAGITGTKRTYEDRYGWTSIIAGIIYLSIVTLSILS